MNILTFVMYRGIKYRPIPKTNGRLYYQQDHGGRYLHRVIWREHYGAIPEGRIVHHVNNNPLDNRIENLQLMVNRRQHFLSHHDPVESGKKGGRNGVGDSKRRSKAHYRRMQAARIRKLRGRKPQE